MKHRNSPKGGSRNVRADLLREERMNQEPPKGGKEKKK